MSVWTNIGPPKHSATSYEQFRQMRHILPLDGLRAVSVILVLSFHSNDPLFAPIKGYLGVTVFFVISGFLITTLLLREFERNGTVSLAGFYIRRVFRIFPLYFLALFVSSVLVLVLGLGQDPSQFLDRLPLLATFNGEFAGAGTFSHSWSLGIEEKFYLLWPILVFVFPFTLRTRLAIASVLAIVSIVSQEFDSVAYFSIYSSILAGCVLAIVMQSPFGFKVAKTLAWWPFTLYFGAIFIYLLLTNDETGYQHVGFGLCVALLFPSLIIGPKLLVSALSYKPLRFVGTLAYGIYLFHPLVLTLIGRVLAPGQGLIIQLVRFLLLVGVSVFVAYALNKVVEKPMIRIGRKVAHRYE